MPGFQLRAPQRPGEYHEEEGDWGDPKAAVLANAAAWIAAAWPGTAPDNRHSRRVALLKRVLPAIGLALLLLIAVWPRLAPLWERMRMAFPAIDLREARELRMINPRYVGTDRDGHPYVITAAVGRQVPQRDDVMSLDQPVANVQSHSGAKIVITSDSGVYQTQTQFLDMFGKVTVTHENGSQFVTSSARLDAANDAAEGHAPVEGHGPQGDVTGQGFQILDKGDTIIFTGKSDMLLRGAAQGTEKRPPATLPTPIAAIATRVEAEAKPALAAALPAPAARHPAPSRPATGQPATRHADNRHAHPAHRALPAKPTADKKAE